MSEFSLPFVPRYAEVDQQGVVFNGHYLTWFDEAFTGLLDHCGVAYPDVMAGGLDSRSCTARSTSPPRCGGATACG